MHKKHLVTLIKQIIYKQADIYKGMMNIVNARTPVNQNGIRKKSAL